MGYIQKTGRKVLDSDNVCLVKEMEQRAAFSQKKEEAVEHVPRKDSVSLSQDWEEKTNLKKSVKELLEELKKQYSEITIGYGSTDFSGIKGTAAKLGNGTHLVITQDFLERMWGSQEGFEECRDVLTEALEQLSSGKDYYKASGALLEGDQLSYWTVPKREDELHSALTQAQKMLENFKEQNSKANTAKNKSFRYSASASDYDAAGKYARLAGAGSKSAVQTIMGEAQRSIGSLRMVSCFGDDKERMTARATIRSLQKLLLRGRRKISRLNEETLLEIRKKRAREQEMEEREQKIRAELRKKRQSRCTADGAIRMEGKLDAYWLDWRRKCLRAREEQQQEYEAAMLEGAAGGGISTAPVGSGESFAASEVVVSAPISF